MKAENMKELQAIVDGENAHFCFVRHDEKKISYLFRRDEDEKFKLYNSHMRGSLLKTGRLPDGRIIVFAADGKDLVYMVQNVSGYPEFTGIRSYDVQLKCKEIKAIDTATGSAGVHLCVTLVQENTEKLLCWYAVCKAGGEMPVTSDETETAGTFVLNNHGNDVFLYHLNGIYAKICGRRDSQGKLSYFWEKYEYEYADRQDLQLGHFVNGNAVGICAVNPRSAMNDIVDISFYRKEFKFKLRLYSYQQSADQYDIVWRGFDYYSFVVSGRKLYSNLMKEGCPDYKFVEIDKELRGDQAVFFKYGSGNPCAMLLDKESDKIYILTYSDETWRAREWKE